jgi:predicted AlkP superfamily phosphohydrolase/phosphomutase
MRKIELQNYLVNTPLEDGTFKPKPYNVKESMVSCLLHPILKLTGRELLLRNKLATRIEEAEIVEGNGHILVEEEDYRKLRQAFETIEGFTKSDMELVRRVLEAEEIDVKEAETKSEKKPIKGKREK